MSHTVNITRTTTTVTTTGLFLNTGYFKTVPGLLKLFQAVSSLVKFYKRCKLIKKTDFGSCKIK